MFELYIQHILYAFKQMCSEWLPGLDCFSKLFVFSMAFPSEIVMSAISTWCSVWHLCAVIRRKNIDNLHDSCNNVALETFQIVSYIPTSNWLIYRECWPFIKNAFHNLENVLCVLMFILPHSLTKLLIADLLIPTALYPIFLS